MVYKIIDLLIEGKPMKATFLSKPRAERPRLRAKQVYTGSQRDYNRSNACTCPERPAQHYELFNNDPSAGSPTETLLRLLLPLNDQV